MLEIPSGMNIMDGNFIKQKKKYLNKTSTFL